MKNIWFLSHCHCAVVWVASCQSDRMSVTRCDRFVTCLVHELRVMTVQASVTTWSRALVWGYEIVVLNHTSEKSIWLTELGYQKIRNVCEITLQICHASHDWMFLIVSPLSCIFFKLIVNSFFIHREEIANFQPWSRTRFADWKMHTILC